MHKYKKLRKGTGSKDDEFWPGQSRGKTDRKKKNTQHKRAPFQNRIISIAAPNNNNIEASNGPTAPAHMRTRTYTQTHTRNENKTTTDTHTHATTHKNTRAKLFAAKAGCEPGNNLHKSNHNS